jgi:hypothetical protein
MNWFTDDERERLLRRFVEDRLDPDEERRFEQLVEEDPAFEQEAHTLREQAGLLGRAPEAETPPDLASSIMERISGTRPPSRVYAFLFKPRTVRVRVMTGLSAAAAIAAVVVLAIWGGIPKGRPGGDTGAPGSGVAGEEIVSASGHQEAGPAADEPRDGGPPRLHFAVAAEDADRVTLVGDFNGWDEDGLELVDEDGDGVWTLELQTSPGRYKYRLLVDGVRWMADPEADAQVDDGFGGTDSVRYVL